MMHAQNTPMNRIFLALCIPGLALAQAEDMQPIRGFAIDKTEVSIEQFARYSQATGFVTAAEKAGGGSTYEGGWVQRKGWTWRMPFGLPTSSKEPAVHITFSEAKAYCQWAGKRLPTDAEWMEAAYTERRASPPAGFATGQTYPYPTGSSPQGANCIGDCGSVQTPAAYANPAMTSRGRGHALTGSTRAGVNGLHEMGGNAWEWTEGGSESARPTRGGSWWYGASQMHRDHLQTKPSDTAVVYIGFRCARSL
ncbi:formylglycine-generating enzyme family protein [Variovorax sp. PCZ-1]|nr:formylglycine-generating enzyme family protein [Variovorax sp. PCZ-1]